MFIVYILKFFLLLFDLCFQLVPYFERVNLERWWCYGPNPIGCVG